jgi:hypothetical protein
MRSHVCSTLATSQTPLGKRDSGVCCRNDGDTGNGIETLLSRRGPHRSLFPCRNDGDTGNGIETRRGPARYGVPTAKVAMMGIPETGLRRHTLWTTQYRRDYLVGMMGIPETGLRLSLRQRGQRVRQLFGLNAMWGRRRAAWIEQVE